MPHRPHPAPAPHRLPQHLAVGSRREPARHSHSPAHSRQLDDRHHLLRHHPRYPPPGLLPYRRCLRQHPRHPAMHRQRAGRPLRMPQTAQSRSRQSQRHLRPTLLARRPCRPIQSDLPCRQHPRHTRHHRRHQPNPAHRPRPHHAVHRNRKANMQRQHVLLPVHPPAPTHSRYSMPPISRDTAPYKPSA